MLTQSVAFANYEKAAENGQWVHRAWYRHEIKSGDTVVASSKHCVTFRPDTSDPEALSEVFPMPDGSRKTCKEIMADCQI